MIIVIIVVFNNPKSKLGVITSSGLYFSIVLFLYLWGQWPLVGSFYLRYVIIGILVLIVIFSIIRFLQVISFFPHNPTRYLFIISAGLLSIILLTMDVYVLVGGKFPDGEVHLKFPLKNGKYYISSGGSNKFVNNHYRDYPNSQQYALDINKIGKYGSAYKSIFSNQVSNHHIFSDTIYCPCTGTIIESEYTINDNLTSSMNVKAENGRGNFITIDCDGILVSLYHLKMNSIFNPVNSLVTAGEPLGLVGNSGFSQEPHLHIQASKHNPDSVEIGVPIKFGDRYFSRNDVISND